MYLSELPGQHQGCRQAAIDGHKEIGRRCRELGVDTIVVFDTHWLVNSGYHINCAPAFEGVYTSNELPHFIKNLPTPIRAIRAGPHTGRCRHQGRGTRAHDATTLALEYGTLVPMRYMNPISTSSGVGVRHVHGAQPGRQRPPGLAMRQAVEEQYDGKVAFLASGSLSHRFAQNGVAEQFLHKVWSPFLETFDHEVVAMWQRGDWKPSAPCCRSMRKSVMAKASCTTPPCCWAHWAGTNTRARPR
jgi:3,4-dihydroxyphenylacetate 2,3-dioxygenase